MLKRKFFGRIDYLTLLITAVILVFGLVSISSAVSSVTTDELSVFDIAALANTESASLQLIFYAVGLLAVAVILLIDYNNLRDFSDLFYWAAVALLVLVLFFGREINGTAGWFVISGRGFQPSEYGKAVIIIVLAAETAKVTQNKESGIDSFRDLWPILWRFMIPFVLIMAQPDMGSAFVYLFVMAGILFAARLSWKKILFFLGLAAVAAPLLWLVMDDYQKVRFEVFLNPELDPLGKGLQTIRAKNVAASGGLFGKGFFSSELLTQQTNYLPEESTDFIFSAMVEACGFIGGLILIMLYACLIFRILRIAFRAKDHFGCYLAVGVAFMILFHVIENIGMNIGLLPITGVPLPLFSYGGSNVLTTMAGIGLALNVHMRRQRMDI